MPAADRLYAANKLVEYNQKAFGFSGDTGAMKAPATTTYNQGPTPSRGGVSFDSSNARNQAHQGTSNQVPNKPHADLKENLKFWVGDPSVDPPK